MLRFKQQTRRDHVVSLLPPISVIKNKEPSVQERIYSDDPPPIAYTGSFPAKVLRHLDKSTFYSTPTKGETLLAKKTMHDEEQRTYGKNEVKRTENKDSRTDHEEKNKFIKSKRKKKGAERKVDGMKEEEVRCSSAPGFRQDDHRQEVPLETGNLTAPVTPRFNAPIIGTRKSARKTSRVYTPTRSTTPKGFDSPDLGSTEQDTEVVLELRGDRIEAASLVKDFGVDSTPTSLVGTTCRLDWHGRIPEQGVGTTKPKVRSAIREVPCTQKKIEKSPREHPKFEIRAVGFSLIFHEKSESNSTPMMKERKNDAKVNMKDIKAIKIPRAEGESLSLSSLTTVTETEADDTSTIDNKERSPKGETDSVQGSTAKENNNSQENEQTESKEITNEDCNTKQRLSNEDAGNERNEYTENVVKCSEKLEESLKEADNENGNENRKENESGNDNGNEHKMENENDIMKEEKKESLPLIK